MPTMDLEDAMDLVSKKLKKDNLYNLSIKLGMGNAVAEEVQHDYFNAGIREIIFQLLQRWRRKNGNKATVPVLAKALKEIDHNDLVQEIYPDIANQVTQDNSRRQNRMNRIEPDGISTSTCHNSASSGEQAAARQVPMDLETAIFTVQKKMNPKNFSQLATRLGLPVTVVDEKRYDYPNAIRVAIYKLLVDWTHTKGKDATVHALAKALVKIEEIIIAQEIYPGLEIPVNVEASENMCQSNTSRQPQATGHHEIRDAHLNAQTVSENSIHTVTLHCKGNEETIQALREAMVNPEEFIVQASYQEMESHETVNRQGTNENDQSSLRQRPPRERPQNSPRNASEQEATNASNDLTSTFAITPQNEKKVENFHTTQVPEEGRRETNYIMQILTHGIQVLFNCLKLLMCWIISFFPHGLRNRPRTILSLLLVAFVVIYLTHGWPGISRLMVGLQRACRYYSDPENVGYLIGRLMFMLGLS